MFEWLRRKKKDVEAIAGTPAKSDITPQSKPAKAQPAPEPRTVSETCQASISGSLANRRRELLSVLKDVIRQNPPKPGTPATEVAGLTLRSARVVRVKAGGLRVLAELGEAGRTYAYTLRRDGTYRREGVPDKRAPLLAISQPAAQ